MYDVFAVRVILDSDPEHEKSDCWKVYSLVTGLYRPNPLRLRDWISTPKANGYEALHITVMGPEGKWVEVQIRTKRMDDIAEKGLAAHWKYKENDSTDSKLDEWIGKIRETLENSASSTIDFIDDLKMNLFSEEIFVFTPAGDLKNLPKGATALDFAYEIHSSLGDQCIGAKVNHKLVPLSYELSNGEQVEILHSSRQTPKEDWLSLIKTAKSKHCIKASLKKNKKAITEKGADNFRKILIQMELLDDIHLTEELVNYYKLEDEKELYYKIALKKIDHHSIKNYLDERKKHIEEREKSESAEALAERFSTGEVLKIGDENLGIDYNLSECCHPIPGDEVFGFITNDEGVQVHKTNCPNAMHLQANFAFRSIKAKWDSIHTNLYQTGLQVTGTDDIGLLNKILTSISEEEKINMKSVIFDSESGIFEGKIMLYVQNTKHVNALIKKLNQIEDIQNIKRIDAF